MYRKFMFVALAAGTTWSAVAVESDACHHRRRGGRHHKAVTQCCTPAPVVQSCVSYDAPVYSAPTSSCCGGSGYDANSAAYGTSFDQQNAAPPYSNGQVYQQGYGQQAYGQQGYVPGYGQNDGVQGNLNANQNRGVQGSVGGQQNLPLNAGNNAQGGFQGGAAAGGNTPNTNSGTPTPGSPSASN